MWNREDFRLAERGRMCWNVYWAEICAKELHCFFQCSGRGRSVSGWSELIESDYESSGDSCAQRVTKVGNGGCRKGRRNEGRLWWNSERGISGISGTWTCIDERSMQLWRFLSWPKHFQARKSFLWSTRCVGLHGQYVQSFARLNSLRVNVLHICSEKRER